MEPPIENCYWVSPGKLLAGEYPRNADTVSSQEKINALLEAGVTAFIDLTEATEGMKPYLEMLAAATHQRFPIQDMSAPPSPDITKTILDAIDQHIDTGGTVYVHCLGGVGRTGVIVGCWLARHGLGGEAALARLGELWKKCPKSKRWPDSPQTLIQRRHILAWTEGQ